MNLWDQFLKDLSRELSEETIQKWLSPLRLINFDARNLYLRAQNPFQLEWFEEHIRPRLYALKSPSGKRIKVHIALEKEGGEKIPPKEITIFSKPLHPYFTFPFFCKTTGNSLAYELLSKLPENATFPGFNPIYIYGKNGSGKTHLLSAIAHLFLGQGKKIFFVDGETFTYHMVGAIRQSRMQEFRKSYREIDVLLLDDIHVFSRRVATQEEFFHTFNTLHTLSKQMIFTSTLAPSQLQEIEPRLISRFEWGLTVPIENKPEDLKEILIKKLQAYHLLPSEELITFLLTSFSSSTIALVSAVEALALRLQIYGNQQISPATAQTLLKDLIENQKKVVITPQLIVKQVADYFSITPADILGKSQSRESTLPRQIAMYLCRVQLKIPLCKIGRFFERNHSTVITSIKLVEKNIQEKNPNITRALGFLLNL